MEGASAWPCFTSRRKWEDLCVRAQNEEEVLALDATTERNLKASLPIAYQLHRPPRVWHKPKRRR
jgi:hypothetical protein